MFVDKVNELNDAVTELEYYLYTLEQDKNYQKAKYKSTDPNIIHQIYAVEQKLSVLRQNLSKLCTSLELVDDKFVPRATITSNPNLSEDLAKENEAKLLTNGWYLISTKVAVKEAFNKIEQVKSIV